MRNQHKDTFFLQVGQIRLEIDVQGQITHTLPDTHDHSKEFMAAMQRRPPQARIKRAKVTSDEFSQYPCPYSIA
jgi:hypothetical protein